MCVEETMAQSFRHFKSFHGVSRPCSPLTEHQRQTGKVSYIAHEFLVNNAITKSIANFSDRKLYGDLFRAIYELEQIIILYDRCEEHNGW
jgi:hypothetical protein